MGMQIFESSGTFDPAVHGLRIGDVLQIVCVGGGNGGNRAGDNGTGGAAGKGGSYLSSFSAGDGYVIGSNIIGGGGGAGGGPGGNGGGNGGGGYMGYGSGVVVVTW